MAPPDLRLQYTVPAQPEAKAATTIQRDHTTERVVHAVNYGKGFSLVFPRSEVPVHKQDDRLVLKVSRLSSPEKELKLYARDDQTTRDIHFVVTELNPKKGEQFVAKSIEIQGLGGFAREYNENKPHGLENTKLVARGDAISLQADGMDMRLKNAELRAYGAKITLKADAPTEFQHQKPGPGVMRISKGVEGFELSLSDGSRTTSIRREGQTLIPASEKTRSQAPEDLEGLRGRRGGEINLDKVDDRAWLAGLIIGEGSFFAASVAGRKGRIPELAIAMQDEQAIDRAAAMMGVRKTSGYVSPVTGRMNWRVQASGARAIEISEKLKPFLTEAKVKQAENATSQARETGFMTKAEMKERQMNRILAEVTAKPGASSREIRERPGINQVYALRYLRELRNEGKIEERKSDTPKHRISYWFPEDSSGKRS